MIGFDSIAPEQMPACAAVSALTLAELAAGPVVAVDGVARYCRADRLNWAEASFEALVFDHSCAHSYARIYSAVLAAGRKARGANAVDLMIAATALAHELPLYTLNAADLRGLDDLIEIVDLA